MTPTKEIIIKFETTELFEVIYVDFCGPFKMTMTGKK